MSPNIELRSYCGQTIRTMGFRAVKETLESKSLAVQNVQMAKYFFSSFSKGNADLDVTPP